MNDFLEFWTLLLGSTADFLLTPPVIWFTACFLLLAVGRLVRGIIY